MPDTSTLGTIEHIDFAQIEVETNIRTTVKLEPTFLASIREYGVLTPVGYRRNEGGTVSVRIGQGGVLAATLLGLDAQDSEWGQSLIDPMAEVQPGRAGHLTLAAALGAIERRGRTSPRSPRGIPAVGGRADRRRSRGGGRAVRF